MIWFVASVHEDEQLGHEDEVLSLYCLLSPHLFLWLCRKNSNLYSFDKSEYMNISFDKSETMNISFDKSEYMNIH